MNTTSALEYSDAQGKTLVGRLARPAGTDPHPAVLIAHTWSGCDDFVQQKAALLAQMGYTALAVDLYGDGRVAETLEEKQALLMPLVEDRALLRNRMNAALQALLAQPGVDSGRIAVMGYCLGGMAALELVRSGADIAGAVSFHGLLGAGNVPNEKIRAKVLVLHGEEDPMVPPDQVRGFVAEMNQAGVDWQIHSYSGARHSFTNPDANDPELGTVYNADADRRSWQAMRNFFGEVLA